MKQTGILWVAADNKKAMHFEPKTCENVRETIEITERLNVFFIDLCLFGTSYTLYFSTRKAQF